MYNDAEALSMQYSQTHTHTCTHTHTHTHAHACTRTHAHTRTLLSWVSISQQPTIYICMYIHTYGTPIFCWLGEVGRVGGIFCFALQKGLPITSYFSAPFFLSHFDAHVILTSFQRSDALLLLLLLLLFLYLSRRTCSFQITLLTEEALLTKNIK